MMSSLRKRIAAEIKELEKELAESEANDVEIEDTKMELPEEIDERTETEIDEAEELPKPSIEASARRAARRRAVVEARRKEILRKARIASLKRKAYLAAEEFNDEFDVEDDEEKKNKETATKFIQFLSENKSGLTKLIAGSNSNKRLNTLCEGCSVNINGTLKTITGGELLDIVKAIIENN